MEIELDGDGASRPAKPAAGQPLIELCNLAGAGVRGWLAGSQTFN